MMSLTDEILSGAALEAKVALLTLSFTGIMSVQKPVSPVCKSQPISTSRIATEIQPELQYDCYEDMMKREYEYYAMKLLKPKNWVLTKKDGRECTIEDQSDDTIKYLLETIKG